MIVLVGVVSLHLINTTYNPYKPDELERKKFIDAIKSVQIELQTASRYAQYPAIYRIGRNVSSDGVNIYLVSGGKEKMKEDLVADYTRNLNSYLRRISKTNGSVYTLYGNGIPVTVYEIQPEDVSVTQTSTGLIFSFITHMNSSSERFRYENNENITSEVPVRLFEMFDRAKAFHERYEDNVEWAMTAALIVRAYIRAYSKQTGSFLKEGDSAYDPLQQLLSGELAALKNFSIKNIDDMGSTPTSTYLSEWYHLSEPSFLPPSFDFQANKAGNAKIVDYMKRNYDVSAAADCDTLSGEERETCEDWNNIDKLKAHAADLTTKKNTLENLAKRIDSWTPNTAMSCDVFKSQADSLIRDATKEFSPDLATSLIIDPASANTKDTSLNPQIEDNRKTVEDLRKTVDALETIRVARLPPLGESLCRLPTDMDCECKDGPEDCDDPDYCLTCDDPTCNKIRCPPSGLDYTCESHGVGRRRSEEVECTLETCSESCGEEGCNTECETEEFNRTVRIDLCNCGCHPSNKIIQDIKNNLVILSQKIKNALPTLTRQINELNARAKTLEEAENRLNEIDYLIRDAKQNGFDVVSNINYDTVSYYSTDRFCYHNTTYAERNLSTCGSETQSTALFLAQIAAATICCSLTSPCCPAVEYATQWFPALYQIESTITIDEKIVDDKNRIIPVNLFSNESDAYGLNTEPKLYTHAAPEFIIYRNHTVNLKPKTPYGWIIVYLYLPKMQPNAVEKILYNFNDPNCTGKKC